MNEKVIMTAEEEDKNAGVTRDINGNVISEATDNNKLYNLELIKREYHSVTSEFTYQIPIDDILEEFDNVETFKKAANQKCTYGSVSPQMTLKLTVELYGAYQGYSRMSFVQKGGE